MSWSALDEATAEVFARFDRAGVPAILLKGRTLAVWLYDDPAERPYGDADVLVSATRLAHAEQVLADLSYCGHAHPSARGEPTVRIWTRDTDQVAVELHVTLVGVDADPETVWQALLVQSEQIHIASQAVSALASPARVLLVALAAAEKGAFAEKPLRDLSAALERVPEEDWSGAAELADRLAASAAFASGLRLVPTGQALARRLGLSDSRPAAVALRAEASPDLRGAALSMAWIADQVGYRARARAVARVLFPAPPEMRDAYPGSRSGTPGLAAAYFRRLALLSTRFVPAARAYANARRRRE
jgi:hypothetical protein